MLARITMVFQSKIILFTIPVFNVSILLNSTHTTIFSLYAKRRFSTHQSFAADLHFFSSLRYLHASSSTR